MTTATHGRFDLGDFELHCGTTLPDAFLSYATYGTLNAARDNVIVFPTWYTGTHSGPAPAIGTGKALDPDCYFIVVPDMFTNGLSTSPSNCAAPFDGLNFPLVTPYDNVVAQHRLLREQFDVSAVQLVLGFSMSGQQAYHWGALYPDYVARLCSICGSAKTAPHNWLYLNAYKSTLEAMDGWAEHNGAKWCPKTQAAYAGIATTMIYSQDWYREGHYRGGADSLDAFVAGSALFFGTLVPANLYAQTRTWMAADVSDNDRFKGDLDAALGAIKAQTLLMPCDTDMYFRVADNEIEQTKIPNADLKVIRSSWGHMAGMPGANPADDAFVDAALKELLASGA